MQKINLLIKQYGIWEVCKKLFFSTLQPLFRKNINIVLAISTNTGCKDGCNVARMSNLDVPRWLDNGMITSVTARQLRNFLEDGCKGYFIEENNYLAAWGFVQTSGSYKYGSFFYRIPSNVHILKNLFVKPEYRGKSYGKLINEARIGDIPQNCIPVGFVVPENRFALRNLKLLGFEEYLVVKHKCWFNHWERIVMDVTRPGEISDRLMEGFTHTGR